MTVCLRVAWVRIEQDYATVERRKRGKKSFYAGESEKTFTYRGSETGHHIGVIVYVAMKMRYKCHKLTIPAKHYPSLRTLFVLIRVVARLEPIR